jgi:hypothetical protein
MSRNFPGVPKPLTINRNLPPLLDSQRRHGSNNRNNLPAPVIPCRRRFGESPFGPGGLPVAARRVQWTRP